MKRTAILLITLFSFAIQGCGTIRLRYDGEVKTQDGKTGVVQFEKSYPVGGGVDLWCALTGIFLGGACWYYLAMPTVPQKNACRKDAETAVAGKLGTSPYTLNESQVQSTSWSERPDTFDLRWN